MKNGYKHQNQQMNPFMGQNTGQNPYYGNNAANGQFTGDYQAQGSVQNPYYGQPYGQQQYGQNFSQNQSIFPKINLFGETPSDRFLRGLLIGGAAAYLLTNERAQKAVIKAGVKVFGTLAGGVEEFKEKIMDVKAEIEAEQEEGLE